MSSQAVLLKALSKRYTKPDISAETLTALISRFYENSPTSYEVFVQQYQRVLTEASTSKPSSNTSSNYLGNDPATAVEPLLNDLRTLLEYWKAPGDSPALDTSRVTFILPSTFNTVLSTILSRKNLSSDAKVALLPFLLTALEVVVYHLDKDTIPVFYLQILSKIFNSPFAGFFDKEAEPNNFEYEFRHLFSISSLTKLDDSVRKYFPRFAFLPLEDTRSSIYFAILIEYFGVIKGFSKLRSLLEKCSEAAVGTPFHVVDLFHLKLLLVAFTKLESYFRIEYLEISVRKIQIAAYKIIARFSDEQLAQCIDKEVPDVIKHIESFALQAIPVADVKLQTAYFLFNLAKRSYSGTVIQKRCKGISMVNTVLDTYFKKNAATAKEFKPLDEKFAAQWLKENDFVESVLGSNIHIEVVKLSVDCIALAAAYDENFDLKYVKALWMISVGQNSYIKKITYDAILKIFPSMPFTKIIPFLQGLVSELKDADFDDDITEFISVVGFLMIDSPKFSYDKLLTPWEDIFGLKTLWKLIQNRTNISPTIRKKAYSYLEKLVTAPALFPLRMEMCSKCIENIAENRSVLVSCHLLKSILLTFGDKSILKRENMGKAIDSLNQNHSLLTKLMSAMQKYKTQVNEVLKDIDGGKISGINKKCLSNDFYDTDGHLKRVTEWLLFVEFILINSSIRLNVEYVKMIWTELVENSLSSEEKTCTYNWFTRNFVLNQSQSVFTDDVLPYFSKEILSCLDVSTLTICAFNLFRVIFFTLNARNGYLKVNNLAKKDLTAELIGNAPLLPESDIPASCSWEVFANFEVLNFSHLEGMETLRKIIHDTLDDHVAMEAIRTAVAMLANLSPAKKEKKRFEVLDAFVETIFRFVTNRLADGSGSSNIPSSHERVILRSLDLLSLLQETLETLATKKEHLYGSGVNRSLSKSRSKSKDTVNLEISIKFRNEVFHLNLSAASNETMEQLENAVLTHLKIDPAAKEYVCHLKEYDINDRSKTFAQFGFYDGIRLYVLVIHPDEYVATVRDTKAPWYDILMEKRASKAPLSASQELNALPHWSISLKEDQMLVLLRLLSFTPEFAEKSWRLLRLVKPFHERVTALTASIKSEKDVNWAAVFKCQTIYTLLYDLFALESILRENESEELWIKFMDLNGLEYLIAIVYNGQFKNPKNPSFSALLFRIVRYCIVADPKIQSLKTFTLDPLSYPILSIRKQVENDELIKNSLHVLKTGVVSSLELSQFSVDVGILIEEAFSLILSCYLSFPKSMTFTSAFSQMIHDSLLASKFPTVRAEAISFVSTLIQLPSAKVNAAEGHDINVLAHVLSCLTDILAKLPKYPKRCVEFFKSIDIVVRKCSEDDTDGDLNSVFILAANLLCEMDEYEKSAKAYHPAFVGLLNLMLTILEIDPAVKMSFDNKMLIQVLFNQCLYDISLNTETAKSVPKLKSEFSRNLAKTLLRRLVRNHRENFWTFVNSYLVVLDQADLSKDSLDYYHEERPSHKFVGLLNQGNTCYLNSMMQQFYMMSNFVDSILSIENFSPMELEKNAPLTASFFHQLKTLMATLRDSKKKAYNTINYCRSIRDFEGNPINVREQRDAEEFLNSFIDSVETSLKSTGKEKLLDEIFGGKLKMSLISQECDHVSTREEGFVSLVVDVKDQRNIMDGLKQFFKDERLDGDNKYHCSSCNRKVAAVKQTAIHNAPQNLIILLKRFEFDYINMVKNKLNDRCEFPFNLDMAEFCTPSYDDSEDVDFEYVLNGVLVHQGNGESGHYYSYIRDKENGNWFEFNDSRVTHFDVAKLDAATFGGYVDAKDKTTKSTKLERRMIDHNAYLLFYERKLKVKQRLPQLPASSHSLTDLDPVSPIVESHNASLGYSSTSSIRNAVKNVNIKYLRCRQVLKDDFLEFTWDMLNVSVPDIEDSPSPVMTLLFEFLIKLCYKSHTMTRQHIIPALEHAVNVAARDNGYPLLRDVKEYVEKLFYESPDDEITENIQNMLRRALRLLPPEAAIKPSLIDFIGTILQMCCRNYLPQKTANILRVLISYVNLGSEHRASLIDMRAISGLHSLFMMPKFIDPAARDLCAQVLFVLVRCTDNIDHILGSDASPLALNKTETPCPVEEYSTFMFNPDFYAKILKEAEKSPQILTYFLNALKYLCWNSKRNSVAVSDALTACCVTKIEVSAIRFFVRHCLAQLFTSGLNDGLKDWRLDLILMGLYDTLVTMSLDPGLDASLQINERLKMLKVGISKSSKIINKGPFA